MMSEKIPVLNREEIISQVTHAIATWPLYRVLHYRCHPSQQALYLPDTIESHCQNQDCNGVRFWQLQGKSGLGTTAFSEAVYICKNCNQQRQTYYLLWNRKVREVSSFQKVGQYPPPEEIIPRELGAALTKKSKEDLQYYKNALRCRNFNFGLGALSYLRRVVENRMNQLLDLIAELAKAHNFEPPQIVELETIKTSRTFDEKITFAAGILPPSLRPGGHNPVDLLHDIASDGIHNKSDEDCIALFDVSRQVFEYLFKELQVRKAEADSYLTNINVFLEKKSRRKGQTPGNK